MIQLLILFLFCTPAILFHTHAQGSGDSVIPGSRIYVPARVISEGPGYHWFGYYDKLQFDPTGRYVLSAEVDFEGRSPQPGTLSGWG